MKLMGRAGAVWGIGGVMFIIGEAIWRLTPIAWDAFTYPMDWRHWAFLVPFFLFMTVSEGYRGFQKGFSPRVAARARYLMRNPRKTHAIFAPLFCMGFLHATRRRKISATALTTGIVTMVLLVRQLPQPWRGMIDLGVVAGLLWGLVALAAFTHAAFTAREFSFPTDVPEESDRPAR